MMLFSFFLSCIGLVLSIGILFINIHEHIIGTGGIGGIIFSMFCVGLNYIMSRQIIELYFHEKNSEECNVQLDLPPVEEETIVQDKLENGEEKKFKGRPRKEELPEWLMDKESLKKSRKRRLARLLYANSPIEKRKKLSKHRLKNKVDIK